MARSVADQIGEPKSPGRSICNTVINPRRSSVNGWQSHVSVLTEDRSPLSRCAANSCAAFRTLANSLAVLPLLLIFAGVIGSTIYSPVAEPGQVFKIVADLGGPPSGMTAAQIKRAGQDLKVQALLMGTVIDYAESRTGTVATPEVTIQLPSALTACMAALAE